MRRIVSLAAVLVGIGLVGLPFATHLFARTTAAERTFDRFRPLMSHQGLAGARRLYDTTAAGGTELANRAVPTFARDLHMSPAQFNGFVAQNFPAVGSGVRSVPGIVTFVAPIVSGLEREEGDFREADSLPALGLPLTATPWIALGLGALLIAVGVLGLRARRRDASLVILVIAVGMVVAPLALSLPAKTRDARRLGDVARSGLSAQGAKKALDDVKILAAMTEEARSKMVPALGRELHLSAAQLGAVLERDFPAVTSYLKQYDGLRRRAGVIVANQQASVGDFAKADRIPVVALPWLIVAPGALLALLAGLGLARRRPETMLG